MIGFAFIDKVCGNVDYIIAWADTPTDINGGSIPVTELPVDYPILPTQEVVKIENYIVGDLGYECYDFTTQTFGKKLVVSVNKNRTLIGGNIIIHIEYPKPINEIVNLKIGNESQNIYVVNGTVDFNYIANQIGVIQIMAKSSSSFGLNYSSIEILS